MNHEFVKLLELVVGASLVNNFVFARFLGLCIFFGVSKKLSTAAGMGLMFTIIMLINAAACFVIFRYLLVPYHLEYLNIIVFISTVAVLVQASESILKKIAPDFFRKLGIYLALITTNCIILAVPLIGAEKKYTFLETMAFALGSGLGFVLALVIMGSLRERLELADTPQCFKGLPMAFLLAGLLALAFTGFSGIIRS